MKDSDELSGGNTCCLDRSAAPKPAKETLEAAKMATFIRQPSAEQGASLTNALVEQTTEHELANGTRRRRRRKADQASFVRAVGCIARVRRRWPDYSRENYARAMFHQAGWHPASRRRLINQAFDRLGF